MGFPQNIRVGSREWSFYAGNTIRQYAFDVRKSLYEIEILKQKISDLQVEMEKNHFDPEIPSFELTDDDRKWVDECPTALAEAFASLKR